MAGEPAVGAGAGLGAVVLFTDGAASLGIALGAAALGAMVSGVCVAPDMGGDPFGVAELDGVVAELFTPDVVASVGMEPEAVGFWARMAER